MSQDFGSFLRNKLLHEGVSDDYVFEEKGELKPGERREIAVLFLDLGGFTAMSDKLDHEVVHDIAGGVMDALVNITGRFGGYVDKIEGDRIMALFGARKAGENDSTRCVSCGLHMLDVIKTANDILTDSGISVTARVGINSGPVTVAPDAIGHLTAMGRTVNLASRMEETAHTDTILVPDTVHEKCMNLFSWKDMGTIKLKGISSPVHVWRPTASISSSKPRWERIPLVSRSGFAGRSEELSRLSDKLLAQRTGNTGNSRLGGVKHIVLGLKGEAGIGKSRLVHEFVQQQCVSDPDVLVLRGQSLSYAQPAYCLWTSLLCDLLDIESDYKMRYEEFKSKIHDITDNSDLFNSLPFLSEVLSIRSGDKRLSELDSKAIALETRIAFRNLLKALAANKRLIVVLDDLHWIDSTCRNVLEFVISNCSTKTPILFLLIYRPEREDGRTVEFDIKHSYAELEEIPISSIDKQPCQEIIAKILSGLGTDETLEISTEVEDFLLKYSQCNPFFLEELILDTVESNILHENKGRWEFTRPVSGVPIPSSLKGLLQSRLDHLSEEWKGVLQKSSVLGVEFKLKLYNRLAEELSIEKDSREVLNNLERRQFLIGMGTAFEQKYMFRHILIHDAAYNSILESNRKLLHRITAGLIEEMYPDDEQEIADILAHHWERAGVRDKAIQWGIINLVYKVKTYQHEKALELSEKLESWILEQPLDTDSSDKLLEVMMQKVSTLDLLGRRKDQEQMLLRMNGIADEYELSTWKGKIQSALGTVLRITGRLNEAGEFCRNALEIQRRTGNRKYESEALCNLGIISRIKDKPGEAQEYFEMALKINREDDNRSMEGILLGNLGNFYFDQGQMDEAIRYYKEALEINRETGDRRNEGIALGNLGNPLIAKGETELALEYYRQALKLHREVGNRKSEGVTLGNIGVLYFEHDRFDESREYYEKALEIHMEVGNRRMEAVFCADLALLRLKQNDAAGALEYYRKSLAIIEELDLTSVGFEQLAVLHSSLISHGFSEMEAPWPVHWERYEQK